MFMRYGSVSPAEVSRILANVVGISRCTGSSATVCDPACGSGSLLIRAIDAAPFPIMGYGQEKESTTAGLAKMNAVLHRKAEITIKSGNTFSNPQYLDKSDNSILERFDYIVANPLFSMKNWRDGIAGKEYGRFEGYGDMPPEENGDYASWIDPGRNYAGQELSCDGEAEKILFTTVRKFKGLEAEAILIVDAQISALINPENRRLLYTGSSRAKNLLNIAMLEDIETGEYGDYLRSIAPGRNVPKNKKGLKRLLNVTM